MMKSIEMAGGRDDYHIARVGNPHFYPGGMPQIPPGLSLMMGPTDCGGGNVISSSSSPPVPNGYLKERQDDNKNCYSNNSSPHTPDDLSSSNKGRGRRGRYNKNNGWSDYDDRGNKIFASKSELQIHSPAHMRDVKPYKCTQCSKTFANSSYLSQHTRIHLGIKPYQCEICQRKFTQLSHLQQHVRTHTGQKPYKCRHANCTKAFSQLSNLQSHSRCHQTDKPFKCNSCYKCFSEEQALLEHIPKHKESKHLKTHICQFCGKSYTQETYLTKHMQKHSERLEAKRPPIINIPRVSLDTPHFWPKVSPDTANTLVEAINQHDACLQNNEVLSSEHMQRGGSDMNGNADDYVLRLSHHSASSSTPSGSSPIHPHEPLITVSTPGAIKTPPSSVSAFTPIQSMGIGGHHHHNHHLNPHHQHPHIADRGYLSYNTIAFPGSKLPSAGSHQFGGFGGVSNSMDMSKSSNPTGLIALTQIHQYRPPHPLMHTDFMQGLKEKTQ